MEECRVEVGGVEVEVSKHDYNEVLREVAAAHLARLIEEAARRAREAKGRAGVYAPIDEDWVRRVIASAVAYTLLYNGVCGDLSSGLRDLLRDERVRLNAAGLAAAIGAAAVLLGWNRRFREIPRLAREVARRIVWGRSPHSLDIVGGDFRGFIGRVVSEALAATGMPLRGGEMQVFEAAVDAVMDWFFNPRRTDIAYVDAYTRQLAYYIQSRQWLYKLAVDAADAVTRAAAARKARSMEHHAAPSMIEAEAYRDAERLYDKLANAIATVAREARAALQTYTYNTSIEAKAATQSLTGAKPE